MFVGALEGNERSLRVSEKIGFVRAGGFDVLFGEGEDVKMAKAVAMVLPGMEWKEYDESGKRVTVRPTVGTESEEQKRDVLRVD